MYIIYWSVHLSHITDICGQRSQIAIIIKSLDKLNVKLHYLAKCLQEKLLDRVHSNLHQFLVDQFNKKMSNRHFNMRVEDFITIMKDYVNSDLAVMNIDIRILNKLLSLEKEKPDLVPYLAEDKNKQVATSTTHCQMAE